VSFEQAGEIGWKASLRAADAALLDPAGTEWARLSEVGVALHPPAGSAAQGEAGNLEMTSQHVRVRALNSTIHTTLRAKLTLRGADIEAGRLDLGSGSVHAASAALRAPSPEASDHEFSAELLVSAGTLSLAEGFRFRGVTRVDGEDASMLLDIAGASETLRWTLSML
jgi:hypothetical protein